MLPLASPYLEGDRNKTVNFDPGGLSVWAAPPPAGDFGAARWMEGGSVGIPLRKAHGRQGYGIADVDGMAEARMAAFFSLEARQHFGSPFLRPWTEAVRPRTEANSVAVLMRQVTGVAAPVGEGRRPRSRACREAPLVGHVQVSAEKAPGIRGNLDGDTPWTLRSRVWQIGFQGVMVKIGGALFQGPLRKGVLARRDFP